MTYVFATGGDIRYHTRTNHMPQLAVLVANRGAFSRLPRRLQAEMTTLGGWLSGRLNDVHRRAEATIVGLLEDSGVEVLRPSERERALWRDDLARFDWRAAHLGGTAGQELVTALSRVASPARK